MEYFRSVLHALALIGLAAGGMYAGYQLRKFHERYRRRFDRHLTDTCVGEDQTLELITTEKEV